MNISANTGHQDKLVIYKLSLILAIECKYSTRTEKK